MAVERLKSIKSRNIDQELTSNEATEDIGTFHLESSGQVVALQRVLDSVATILDVNVELVDIEGLGKCYD